MAKTTLSQRLMPKFPFSLTTIDGSLLHGELGLHHIPLISKVSCGTSLAGLFRKMYSVAFFPWSSLRTALFGSC